MRSYSAGLRCLAVIAAVTSVLACSSSDAPATSPPIEPYPAASADYRLESFSGIALEVPAHWTVLDSDTRRNLALAGEQRFQSSAYGGGEEAEDKETVLAINATPSPHGAMIRVSRNKSMQDVTSDAIYQMSRADLNATSDEFASMFRPILPEFVSMSGVERVAISGGWALKVSYLRKSTRLNNQDLWEVDQYIIPSDSGIVWQVTLSRRVGDRLLWDPILDRVLRTIRIR